MPKLSLILILSSLLVNTLFVLQTETQANPLPKGVFKFQFYIQAIVGGNNRTEYLVAKSNITDTSPSEFGAVYVVDIPMTSGPEINSREIGRMQGVVAYSDFKIFSLTDLLIFVLTYGRCKGSTLSTVGRSPSNQNQRELPIVGGTGCFRLASGYVISRNYSTDEPTMRQVVKYSALVYSSG